MIYRRNDIELKEGERIDDLERNGYGIIQRRDGFCFGMDAVLLSGFARVRKGESVVDLGTGTGIIPILLEAKTEGRHFYGIEIQEQVAEMASRSVLLNGLEDKIDIINADLRTVIKEKQLFRPGSMDVVTSNPPYMKGQHGLVNPGEAKAISRHEVCCTLKELCAVAAALLKSSGRFYMVHRPQRLPEIISELKAVKLEPKRMKLVHPYIDKNANMVLIEAVKDAGSECIVEKPIIVYKADGSYTDEIYDIYGY